MTLSPLRLLPQRPGQFTKVNSSALANGWCSGSHRQGCCNQPVRDCQVNTIKLHAVNTLKWSAFSLGFVLFVILSMVISGWVSLQVLVFLVQHF